MAEPVVFQKSPIVLDTAAGAYWWCACGQSKKQPFCDGSHKGSGFQPQKVQVEQAGRLAWCACKHSGAKPFCDGTHRKLP
jgi:CDGSH-type Zn-finger protein